MLQQIGLSLMAVIVMAPCLNAEEFDSKQRVEQVVAKAGGEEKLLKLIRFRERILVSAAPAAPVTADEKGNRISVVEVAGDWWLGASKRGKDKVRVLCWAWSLRILLDPKSKIEVLPETALNGKPAFGLRVSESLAEPIDLLFDKDDQRLVAIDYTDTRHLFSEWKKTGEGHSYPSHVTGHRFTDQATGMLNEMQWYQTDILELTPLSELPAELKTN